MSEGMVEGITEGPVSVTEGPDSVGTPVVTESTPVVDTPPADNPAWAPILDVMPESLHPMLKPRLSEWDKHVERLVSKVHQEYEPLKEFKDMDPAELKAARDFYTLANNDPETLYQRMGEHFGFANSGQGQTPTPEAPVGTEPNDEFEEPSVDIENHPAFKQVQEQQQALMDGIRQAHEAELAKNAEAELDQLITTHTSKREGITKEGINYALNLAYLEHSQTGDFEKAIENGFAQYDALLTSVGSKPRPSDSAPQVMPTGGSIPVTGKNVADMTDAERRAYGVARIQQFNQA